MNDSDYLERLMEGVQYISRMMKRNIRNQTLPHGITKTQWFILRILAKSPCTIGQLAERLEVRSSSMSQMIDRLELSGLVEREIDHQDARSKVVKLSEIGKERVEAITHNGMELLSTPFSRLSEEEQKVLVELLEKFNSHLSISFENQSST